MIAVGEQAPLDAGIEVDRLLLGREIGGGGPHTGGNQLIQPLLPVLVIAVAGESLLKDSDVEAIGSNQAMTVKIKIGSKSAEITACDRMRLNL